MDHTLAIYRKAPFETLAFDEARSKLIERMGYPEEFRTFAYDPAFAIRGLVVDKRRGNILKMDQHNYVVRVFHGLRPLSREERKKAYSQRRIRLSSPTYSSVDTLFSLPEVALFAGLVDLMEQRLGPRGVDYGRLHHDVRECVDEAHRDGSIKRIIMRTLGEYLLKDPLLAVALDKLRYHGKKLFILTNSEPDYTDAVMDYLLPAGWNGYRDWTDYFDLVVAQSGKPRFFLEGAPFEELQCPPGAKGREEAWRERKIVRRGSAVLLEKRIGSRGDQILYFGDHTYGDILRSKKSANWRTAMIVQELQEELDAIQATRDLRRLLQAEERARDRLISERDYLERQLTRVLDASRSAGDSAGWRHVEWGEIAHDEKIRRIEQEIAQRTARIEDLETMADRFFNANWGSLFKERADKSRFGEQVDAFACIYSARASHLLYYPINKYFQPPKGFMPHES
jgi:HAD superfamily 5'-nucleotidase-like hydrolase